MIGLHFVVRLLGLLGLLVATAGAIATVAYVEPLTLNNLQAAIGGARGMKVQIASAMLAAGAAVVLLVLILELVVGLKNAAGRRSALGGNVVLQIALALVLLVGLNIWSFGHYRRWDFTRNHQFTLDKDLARRLRELRGETTIVVYQQHKTFGRLSEKPDRYDSAAERKVVEKVKDLVDQLREFGPQFRVVVLDVEEEGFDRKLAAETARFPGLAAAIDAAPENSILFCDGTHVQRMNFNEFYQLDKTASKEADGGRGNLVLLSQGVEPFARRLLAIEEKKPRVGVGVIHELLSTRGAENEFSMAGVKKSLVDNGFEVTDIILKRWGGGGPEPEPAAYTFDENRLDFLEDELADFNQNIPVLEQEVANYTKMIQRFKQASLDELTKQFRDQLKGRQLTEEDRQLNINGLETTQSFFTTELSQQREERAKYEEELARLSQSESAVEGRRNTDLKGKFRRMLAECDMLILPRMTIISILNGFVIRPQLYKVNDAQLAAIRDFVKSGKPVFVLFGPTNEPGGARMPLGAGDSDNLEALFGQLGLVFGKQTILYTAEGKAFAERRANPFGSGMAVEIPPVLFENPFPKKLGEVERPANPISHAMRVVSRSAGQKLDLVIRHARPIYFSTDRARPDYQAEFMFTDPGSWNEEKPFPERSYTPRFEPPKADNPNKGTRDEERRGPFPIGVAVQTTVPPDWLNGKFAALKAAALVSAGLNNAGPLPAGLGAEAMLPEDIYTRGDTAYKPVPVRIAAIGHGGLFNSADAAHPDLSPAKEELLLTTCNWLLGRDDRLPRDDRELRYPRADLSRVGQSLWRWGTFVLLPMSFMCLGLIVLLVRRMR